MKLLAFATPLFIYHDCSKQKKVWEEKFTLLNIKICGRQMSGNKGKFRTMSSTLFWIFFLILIVWTRGTSPLHSQGVIWED